MAIVLLAIVYHHKFPDAAGHHENAQGVFWFACFGVLLFLPLKAGTDLMGPSQPPFFIYANLVFLVSNCMQWAWLIFFS